jgi:hypothetical protein
MSRPRSTNRIAVLLVLVLLAVTTATLSLAQTTRVRSTSGSTGTTDGTLANPLSPPSGSGTSPSGGPQGIAAPVTPIPGRDNSLVLGQLPASPAEQAKIQTRESCPSGYFRAPGRGNDIHITVCQVDTRTAFNFCAARPGFYACGRNASECCPKQHDNSCFPGAYACSSSDAGSGTTRTACCITR